MAQLQMSLQHVAEVWTMRTSENTELYASVLVILLRYDPGSGWFLCLFCHFGRKWFSALSLSRHKASLG